MQRATDFYRNNNIPFIKTCPQQRPKFYSILNNIANRLQLRDTDGSFTKRYLEYNDIPIILCTQTTKAVFIKSFRTPRQKVTFPKINPFDSQILTIHVTEGILELSGNNKTEVLYAPSTHVVNTKITDIIGCVDKIPTNYTIVINARNNSRQMSPIPTTSSRNLQIFTHKPLKHHGPTRFVVNNVKITKLPEQLKPTPYNRNNNPISYVRTKLTQNEIIDRTIFMDAEFVQSENKLLPASVSIINYEGKVVFNRIIKPQEDITNYVTRITGFNKEIINKGMPETAASIMINKIIEGKLIVGADLSQDFNVLNINRDNLIGIRDLSTCKTLRNKMNIQDHRISLAKMVQYFFQLQIHKNVHNSLEDAKFIRDVYIQIEKEYRDDFYSPEEPIETLKNPIIIDLDDDTNSYKSTYIDIDDVESYGTPLMDENLNDIDLDNEPTIVSIEQPIIQPLIQSTSQPQIKSTVFAIKQQTPTNIQTLKETQTITIEIPKTIISEHGKLLKPKYILYEEEKTKNNKRNQQTLEKTIIKYIPNEMNTKK